MSFPDHGVNRKVVDNVENYLNMKFQPTLMTRSRENGQKPIFWKIAYKKKLRVFLENQASSLFYIYNGLTSCNVSEQTNDGKYENFLSLTDWLTDRLTVLGSQGLLASPKNRIRWPAIFWGRCHPWWTKVTMVTFMFLGIYINRKVMVNGKQVVH